MTRETIMELTFTELFVLWWNGSSTGSFTNTASFAMYNRVLRGGHYDFSLSIDEEK